LIGSVNNDRHYYHCGFCHRGFCPFDKMLGLTARSLSPAAEEVACIAGVQTAFAEASDRTLRRLSGLRLSESTVERTTEAAGHRLANAFRAGATVGPATPWNWHRDAEGKTVAYVSADATGVGQQGRVAVKSMAAWRMLPSFTILCPRDGRTGPTPKRPVGLPGRHVMSPVLIHWSIWDRSCDGKERRSA
jgi:hypothetical protein